MLISNIGYVLFGRQTVKGTAVSPSAAVSFQSESFDTMQNVNTIVDDAQGNNLSYVRDSQREQFGFDVYARPNMCAYMIGYLLGTDSVAGAGDPYTHTITRADLGRKWMTMYRKLDTGVVQRLTDAKIESLTIRGQSGKPITMSITGNACSVNLIATEHTIAHETRKPFMFYDGAARFKWATTVDDNISAFSIAMRVDSQGGMHDATFGLVDLPDFDFSVDVTADFYATSTARWKKVNYNNGTTASEGAYSGAFEVDLRYTESAADDRQLKITIPSALYKTFSGMRLTGDPTTIKESIAGVAMKLSTTELITAVVKNFISTI